MREILSFCGGQCGNQIGDSFWQLVAKEHGLNTDNGDHTGHSELELDKISGEEPSTLLNNLIFSHL